METGLRRRAAGDWPITQKKRGLEELLWSVHDCPFVYCIRCTQARLTASRRACTDAMARLGSQWKPSSVTLRVYLVLKPSVVGGIRDGPCR